MIQPASQEEIQRRNAELEAEIAERREAEARLREREERLRLITENITECFWLSDAAISRIEYASPAPEQIWRRPVAELHAHPESFLPAVVPEDLPTLKKHLAGHALGLPYEMEYRIRRPDGSLRWIWDRGFPIRDADGQVRRYAGLAQDITVRRQLEKELRALNATLERRVAERTAEIRAALAALVESEERFRRLFQDTRQPLSLIEDGHFIATNPATLAMLRLERPEQLIGQTPGDFSPPCQPDGQTSAAKAATMMRIA